MYVKLNGEMVYLWRAVDHEGEILESYITRTGDKVAALTFMKKALKRHDSPEAVTTDGLRSYRAAVKELGTERIAPSNRGIKQPAASKAGIEKQYGLPTFNNDCTRGKPGSIFGASNMKKGGQRRYE